MNIQRLILLILILFVNFNSLSQSKVKFGVAMEYGYKASTNRMGFLAQLNFYDRVTLSAGLSSDRFSYLGFNSGVEVSFFKSKWHPVLGLARNRMGSASFTTGDGNNPNLFSWYEISGSTNIVGFLGLERTFLDDQNHNKHATILFYLAYRESLSHPMVKLTRGLYNRDEIFHINKSLSSGWGIGVRASVRFPTGRKRR